LRDTAVDGSLTFRRSIMSVSVDWRQLVRIETSGVFLVNRATDTRVV
jgi:hypothetical protein